MTSEISNDYESVPYPGRPYPQCHPDRLATIGTLLGMEPANVKSCRVLELGCGDGLNLINMALVLPGSEFVGLDLSRVHIEAGLGTARELGLRNITLRACDIRQDLSSLGVFDYLIAHGLYSWVPPDVQERIMALCGAFLAPQGIAYVSYNTYPGGHLRMMLREMMRYHIQGIEDPTQRTQQATALLQFLQASSDEEDPYRLLIKRECERALSFPVSHLFHDDLAEYNTPVYFHEFLSRAGGQGLQFLSEAEYHVSQEPQFPPHVAETLRTMETNPIVREQYIDFIRCRRFRQTLLCRENVCLQRSPEPQQIMKLRIASQLEPSGDVRVDQSGKRFKFVNPRGSSAESTSPRLSAALTLLSRRWPGSLSFSELDADAGNAVTGCYADETEAEKDHHALASLLLRLYAGSFIELRTFEPPLACLPPLQPVASPLARLQVRRGSSMVTNLLHCSVSLDDPITPIVLDLLDGSRGSDALARDLLQRAQTGEITLGQLPTDDDSSGSALLNHLEAHLRHLAKCGLFMKEH